MAGYRVRVAKSVNECLHSMLDEGAPDLLLLDDVLPEKSGCPGAQQAWRELLALRAGWSVIDEVSPQAVVRFA